MIRQNLLKYRQCLMILTGFKGDWSEGRRDFTVGNAYMEKKSIRNTVRERFYKYELPEYYQQN